MYDKFYYLYLKVDNSDVVIRFKNNNYWEPEYIKGDMDLIDCIDIYDYYEHDIEEIIDILLYDFDTVQEIDYDDIEYY